MTTMRAVRAHARGGAEQLRLEDAPRPEPRAGEALIRVHAAGITPTELEWSETWLDRQGHDRTPTIPSHEVSGVVEELGPARGCPSSPTRRSTSRAGRHPRRRLRSGSTAGPPQSLPDATEDVHRHLYQAPDGRYRMRYHRGAAVAGWSEMARPTASVGHAQRPCLLVVAQQEEIVRPELRASLARDLGDWLTTVEIDCGHILYWDAFEETAAALRAFLAP
jgi:alcohol dehydrogenase-like protein